MTWTLVSSNKANLSNLKISPLGSTFLVHVKINNINQLARHLVRKISDTSWVNDLDVVPRLSYEHAVDQTVAVLVKMFNGITNSITKSFGEYAISLCAGEVLQVQFSHQVIPLAELWKTQITGNPGFDFHAVDPNHLIIFGEAKYNKNATSCGVAAKQVVGFLADNKHMNDLVHLAHFVSSSAQENLKQDKKGIALAFSIHGNNKSEVLDRTINNRHVRNLIQNVNDLYILGIEI